MMHKRVLTKADGRSLILYARAPLSGLFDAPSSIAAGGHQPNSHLRWHPLRAEWVAYASHRQHRTFLPPPDYNPLAVSRSDQPPTEVPAGAWDIAVFENLYPTLTMAAHDPPNLSVPTAPGRGVCEVVVFAQDATATLGGLPIGHIELLIDVWADRYEELGRLADVAYVYPFENRGVEVGVTLSHPHGQIYAYPFIPPIPARALEQQRAYYERHGRGLVEDLVAREAAEDVRMIYRGPLVAAFMPMCARYPYEVWIAPYRAGGSFAALIRDERRDFARALKTVLLKFDRLWNRPFPYIMAIDQAPTDGALHPEAHLRAEFYPALRMPGRLKYLAGSEIGAGVFTADTIPEERVKELQAVQVDVDG
jgi:UDPglucose--hexose-1-phosphate uridylyltransferase